MQEHYHIQRSDIHAFIEHIHRDMRPNLLFFNLRIASLRFSAYAPFSPLYTAAMRFLSDRILLPCLLHAVWNSRIRLHAQNDIFDNICKSGHIFFHFRYKPDPAPAHHSALSPLQSGIIRLIIHAVE